MVAGAQREGVGTQQTTSLNLLGPLGSRWPEPGLARAPQAGPISQLALGPLAAGMWGVTALARMGASASFPSLTPTKPGAPSMSLPHSGPQNPAHPCPQDVHPWPRPPYPGSDLSALGCPPLPSTVLALPPQLDPTLSSLLSPQGLSSTSSLCAQKCPHLALGLASPLTLASLTPPYPSSTRQPTARGTKSLWGHRVSHVTPHHTQEREGRTLTWEELIAEMGCAGGSLARWERRLGALTINPKPPWYTAASSVYRALHACDPAGEGDGGTHLWIFALVWRGRGGALSLWAPHGGGPDKQRNWPCL